MESSKRPMGLLKGRYVDSSPRRDQLRLPNIEQVMGDEDWLEAGLRYSRSVKAPRTDEGERSQPRRMGKNSRRTEAGLQSNLAMDDEQKGRV